MSKIQSKDELKFAHLGLELMKKKGTSITQKTATMYIKVLYLLLLAG